MGYRRYPLLVAVLLLSAWPASAAGLHEPNPEFGQGSTDLREFLEPRADVLIEAESMVPLPEGWRVADSRWLRVACSAGQAVSLTAGSDGGTTVTLPAAGRYRLCVRSHAAQPRGRAEDGTRFLAAYGDAAASLEPPNRTAPDARRKTVNHTHR